MEKHPTSEGAAVMGGVQGLNIIIDDLSGTFEGSFKPNNDKPPEGDLEDSEN